jgi:hypothetical protein
MRDIDFFHSECLQAPSNLCWPVVTAMMGWTTLHMQLSLKMKALSVRPLQWPFALA